MLLGWFKTEKKSIGGHYHAIIKDSQRALCGKEIADIDYQNIRHGKAKLWRLDQIFKKRVCSNCLTRAAKITHTHNA